MNKTVFLFSLLLLLALSHSTHWFKPYYYGNDTNDTNLTDLAVTSVSAYPSTVKVGEGISVSVYLSAKGDLSSYPSVEVRATSNGGYKNSVFYPNSVVTVATGTNGFRDGTTTKVFFIYKCTSPGNYILTFTVDPYNKYRETNEYNNKRSIGVTCAPKDDAYADLVAKITTLSGTAEVGGFIPLWLTVTNKGNKESSPTTIKYGDFDGELLHEPSPGLAPGESKTKLVWFYCKKRGTYNYWFAVDPYLDLARRGEEKVINNNYDMKTLTCY